MKPRNLVLHPSCPKRLLTALRRAKGKNGKGWNFSVLAKNLGVNKGTIYKLVTLGIEPVREDIRIKLFLPTHPRKRAGDCNRCGKRVEIAKGGTLTSHVHPDGTFCNGSYTRDYLPPAKPRRQTLPPHRTWWNKQPREFKDSVIKNEWLKTCP